MNPVVEVVDRLSELPDDILVKILSFLPLCDAVRSMLLKRFGSLWTLLPIHDFHLSSYDDWDDVDVNVDVDGDDDSDDDFNDFDVDVNFDVDFNDFEYDKRDNSLSLSFFNFVRNVLMGHRMPNVTKFRVEIYKTYFVDTDERHLGCELDSLIDFALRKNVEILEFYVSRRQYGTIEWMYRLPNKLVSDSITEMTLEFLEMNPQTRVQMGLLRVLRLQRVDISDDVFQEIIRGCPLLKELEIYKCFPLSKLSFDAPNVEKLILIPGQWELIVDCPNLKSFQFTGVVDSINVKDLSSLVDVTFNLESQHSEFKQFEQFMAALKPILRAKAVSFSCGSVIVLFYCMQKQLSEFSINWKHVELSMWLTEKHVHGLCCLSGNSPYLEELVIHVTRSNPIQVIESQLDNCSVDDECSSISLKRVVIYNSSMCLYPKLVHLVKTLLKSSSVLAELKIYYKAREKPWHEPVLSSEQWTEFSNELSTFPKASQDVKVSLLHPETHKRSFSLIVVHITRLNRLYVARPLVRNSSVI